MTALADAVCRYLQGYEGRWREELTEADRNTLDRLAKSPEAARAFDTLATPIDEHVWLIADCVHAARLANGLHRAQAVEEIEWRKKHRAEAKAARDARDGIARYLRPGGFIKEIRPLDAALALRCDEEERFDAFMAALISRKHDKAAARQRAIGVIKESVRQATAKANLELVLTLCEVALDAEGELYPDHVKKASTLSDRTEKALPGLGREH